MAKKKNIPIREILGKITSLTQIGAVAGVMAAPLAKPVFKLGVQAINDFVTATGLAPTGIGRKPFLENLFGLKEYTPKIKCDAKQNETNKKMDNFMRGLSSGGSPPGNAMYPTQDIVEDSVRSDDPVEERSFDPHKMQDSAGSSGGRERCYSGKKSKEPGMGEDRNDRCAQVLDKPSNQDMSYATQIMLDKIEDEVRKANARDRVVF